MGPSKKELQAQLNTERTEMNRIVEQRDDAQRRAAVALAVIVKAAHNLRQLFGPLTELGPDEDCSVLRFDSADGVASIQLNPATGELRMSDPRREVDDQVVRFDTYGRLGDRELEGIRRFRSDVKLSRMPEDITPVYGFIFLTASASPEAVTSAETAALALDGTKH